MHRYKLLILILLAVLFMLASGPEAYSQDTNYVRRYGNLFSLKAFGYDYEFAFQNHTKGFSYIPDHYNGLGVGVWCKYFPFDICYRQAIAFGRDEYHNVKSTDMQLRGYNKFFVGDIYVQKYSGFYENISNRFIVKPGLLDDLQYNPDISVNQFDMVGKYIFNHERFSYKAGFTANEQQLKSAGSFTAGAALYFLKIKSDSLLLTRDEADLKSCNIGLNGGYAYNLVFGKRSTLFASASVGLNASNLLFHKKGDKDIRVSPVLHLKGAYWVNFEKWSFGATATYNLIHHTLNQDTTLYVHTQRIEALVIRRFWWKS